MLIQWQKSPRMENVSNGHNLPRGTYGAFVFISSLQQAAKTTQSTGAPLKVMSVENVMSSPELRALNLRCVIRGMTSV